MKIIVCVACQCHLEVKTLEGEVLCAACGCPERMVLKKITSDVKRCTFCTRNGIRSYPVGRLC